MQLKRLPISMVELRSTIAVIILATTVAAASPEFNSESASNSEFPGAMLAGEQRPEALRLQVLLDHAGFSPGVIDGVYGGLTDKALQAYQRAHGLRSDRGLDKKTWKRLNKGAVQILTTYTVTADDLAGPYVEIPDDMMKQAELEILGFESALEGLAEKFHCSAELLEKLNPGMEIEPGASLTAPNVEARPELSVAEVLVVGDESAVYALDADGNVLAYYPATMGGEHDPLPIGEWKILGVKENPEFHYNPDLFWDSDPDHSKATLAPGPNSPVGVVWMDLDKPHYGLHGTPAPESVGRSNSHGCIRLTNWDALELAKAVGPNTPVSIKQSRE